MSAPIAAPTVSRAAQHFAEFEKAISQDRINITVIRSLARSGAPERGNMRPLIWKLLLNYLGPNRSAWPEELQKSRASYRSFVKELTTNPFKDDSTESPNSSQQCSKSKTSFQSVSALDDPLSVKVENTWTKFYQDEREREEIAKDVRRTHASFHFFAAKPLADPYAKPVNQTHSALPSSELQQKLNALTVDDQNLPTSSEATISPHTTEVPAKSTPDQPDESGGDHAQSLARLLFIYSKLNPCIGYVQGMNEVLAPIYYVFFTDKSAVCEYIDGVSDAECDAFFCFTSLMSSMRDRFIKALDEAPTGILAALRYLEAVLKLLDPQLHHHLMVKNGVDPRFFAFRWLTLLLSQEFSLPDVLRLWDSVFADEKLEEGMPLLSLICVSMLVCIRTELLAGSFPENIQLLQQYPSPPVDLLQILRAADHMSRQVDQRALNSILEQHQVVAAAARRAAQLENATLLPIPTSKPSGQSSTSKPVARSTVTKAVAPVMSIAEIDDDSAFAQVSATATGKNIWD